MANRTTLDPANQSGPTKDNAFTRPGARSIGPSDSSDSGSDLAGQDPSDGELLELDADAVEETDAASTGERVTAGEEPDVRIAADIGLDRIVGPEEAGLGGGLDQAEEARLGITDEEIAELARTRSPEK